jgi:streptomycin 6-kinase
VFLPQNLREGVIAWMPDGQDWADSLPAMVEHCRALWQLEIGDPYEGGATAWVAPAERADGSSCVLKVSYPDDESRHEPDALERWAGNGAVRLIECDEVTGVLLLERLQPGTSLRELTDTGEAMTLACGILRRLWQPAGAGHPFVSAQVNAARWAVDVERDYRAYAEPFDPALLRAAVSAFEQLAAFEGECVILHQDFHRGNVLRAQREPWLAIDPKPLAGERAFDARWMLNDLLYQEPCCGLEVGVLLEQLSTELSLEAERIRLWTLARAVQNALWCYEIGEDAADDVALAAALL